MTYLKEGLRRGFIGMLLGVFLSHTMIVIATAGASTASLDVGQMQLYYFGYGIGAFWFSGISVFFSIEEWSFLRQIGTHILTTLPFLPISALTGFMPGAVGARIAFIGIYVFCYVMSFVAYKWYLHSQANAINGSL